MIDNDNLLNQLMQKFAEKCGPIFREIIFEAVSQLNVTPEQRNDDEHLMTLSETMAFFHCSKATLYNWRKSGKIKSFKIGGKLYYKKETLLKNLKERKF
jgi:hypothetical protein